jgi:hypothetical protein
MTKLKVAFRNFANALKISTKVFNTSKDNSITLARVLVMHTSAGRRRRGSHKKRQVSISTAEVATPGGRYVKFTFQLLIHQPTYALNSKTHSEAV